MINVQDIPAVRELLEQEEARVEQQAAEPAPQCVRAPEGNGHEAAVRQQGGAR
jgi:hypothetical protein